MSKKKYSAGKKAPRQPVGILICLFPYIVKELMPSTYHYLILFITTDKKGLFSRMITVNKGVPRFSGLSRLDHLLDKYDVPL